MKKVGIAADHAGYEYKEWIKGHFDKMGINYTDYGTTGLESVDYPDFVHPMAEVLETGGHEFGVVICGSGNGVNITANKHGKVRSALCWMPEIARLARQHNNANCVAIPARFIAKELALEIVTEFLRTTFEGGRHQNRVDKIGC